MEFLVDEQDTVEFYEAKGKEKKPPSHNDQLMMALSSLDRVQQVEAIHGTYIISALFPLFKRMLLLPTSNNC